MSPIEANETAAALWAEVDLYLVPTPLGNLEDLSPRARAVLATADLIAAEDTRVTGQLLLRLGLKKKIFSYHEHNARQRETYVLEQLATGQHLALVSDAGMPCISDPGEALVAACRAAGYRLAALPGPNAGLTALVASGLPARRFVFEGFIEVKGKARAAQLARIAAEASTQILYEAPHRLLQTLEDLSRHGLGARRLCIGRELTKVHESYYLDTVDALYRHFSEDEKIRGEFCLVLEGAEAYLARCPEAQAAAGHAVEARLRTELLAARESGLALREAVRVVKAAGTAPKNEIYKLALEIYAQND